MRHSSPKLSYGYTKMNIARGGYRVFSANSSAACTELAQKITERLGVELGKSVVYQESNSETRVDVKESVRGQDIFIIQTIPRKNLFRWCRLFRCQHSCHGAAGYGLCPKDVLCQEHHRGHSLLSLQQAVQDEEERLHCLQAASIHVSKSCLTQFLPPSRKRLAGDCRHPAGWAVGVDTHVFECDNLRTRGRSVRSRRLTHIITMDLHQKEIQGFFNFPVDNLRASPFLIQYIQEEIPNYRNAVIVAKSPSAAKRAQSYAERLRLGLAVIHGEAHHSESDMADGRHSPPLSRAITGHTGLELPSSSRQVPFPGIELPMMMAKEKPPISVVGDVGGRIAIIVDDIIDDVEDFVAAAEILKERGAYKIYVMATHGLLSAEAPRLIEESAIDEVVVTNTVPHEVQKLQCPKIKTVDVSMILAEAIRRIHNGESMAYLFRNIAMDD
uniref:Phosphoribosyl pyrophosphate synthetase associated protein 1 n=1 Tax=Oreochromis niloticus TaxID=8128 RepID=A0A669BNK6_ORENI